MLALRDYQFTNVNEIQTTFARHRRVLFVLPTGGGKTIIFAHITTWIRYAAAEAVEKLRRRCAA